MRRVDYCKVRDTNSEFEPNASFVYPELSHQNVAALGNTTG